MRSLAMRPLVRRSLVHAAVLALVGCAALLSSHASRAEVFSPTTATLDNGMRVVVIENRRAPVVTHMVWYKVGAADEPPGRGGIAHVVEHLMFKGTPATPDPSAVVSRLGGRENAFTSQDYTAYFQSIAVEHLERMMALEADRMVNLDFTDAEFATERDVVVEERLSRTDNEPSGLLSERLSQALWVTHPYARPIIGWRHELEALTAADARWFHDHWYAPNNAVLVVAGDVSPESVIRLARKHYGPLAPADVPARDRPPPPEEDVAVSLTMRHAQVGQPSWTRRIVAPSHAVDPDGHADALLVLSQVLGGGPTSRLYRTLVIEQGLAASAGTWYHDDAVDLGTFGLYVSPRPGTPLDRVRDALLVEIAAVARDGVDAERVADAKRRMVAEAVYARDSLHAPPRILGSALVTGMDVDFVESWPDRIAAVTPAAANAAARAVRGESGRYADGILMPPDRRAEVDGQAGGEGEAGDETEVDAGVGVGSEGAKP